MRSGISIGAGQDLEATGPRKNQPQGLDFSWCSIVDAFQTAAIDAQEDYKLKYLVEQFQLADNLI